VKTIKVRKAAAVAASKKAGVWAVQAGASQWSQAPLEEDSGIAAEGGSEAGINVW
jgi:hypothetical protein